MKTLAYILILIILFYMLPSPTEASTSARAIQHARNDAERNINKELWFMSGCCLSGVAYMIASLTASEIPVDKFVGQPPEYVFFYIQEYERKTARLRAYYATLGALANFGILTIFALYRAAD